MKMSNKIVFFGNERLATGVATTAPVLQALIAAGYEVMAVVAQNELSKSRKPRELEIDPRTGMKNYIANGNNYLLFNIIFISIPF